MNLNEFLMNEEVIDEGLKYFKKSKKLEKHINSIKTKLNTERANGISEEQKRVLTTLITHVSKLKTKFEKIENDYLNKVIDKKTAKEKSKKLVNDNKKLFNDLNSPIVKKALAAIGLSAGLGVVIAGLIPAFYLISGGMMALNVFGKGPNIRHVDQYIT